MRIKDKLKIYVPIILLAIIFYMMLSTPHSRPLGDILLEDIGLKAWSDGYNGTHLTVIYLGVLFFVVLELSKRLITVKENIGYKHKILIFAVAVTIIYLTHSAVVHRVMENADGLNTIAIAPSGNSYEYKIVDGKVESFELEFELTNYSKEARRFSLGGYINDIIRFEIYKEEGELAKYYIQGKGTATYKVNSDNHVIKMDGLGEMHNLGGRGIVDSLILIDEDGNSTKIIKLRNRGILN